MSHHHSTNTIHHSNRLVGDVNMDNVYDSYNTTRNHHYNANPHAPVSTSTQITSDHHHLHHHEIAINRMNKPHC